MIGKQRKDDIKLSFQRIKWKKSRLEPDVLNVSLNTSARYKETHANTTRQYGDYLLTSLKPSTKIDETKSKGEGPREKLIEE